MTGNSTRILMVSACCSLLLVACEPVSSEICPNDDPALHVGLSTTTLKDDCRCIVGDSTKFLPGCLDIERTLTRVKQLGDGPSPYTMGSFARIRNGDLWADRNQIITAVSLGSNQPGFVMSLDIDTGVRGVISGTWIHPSKGAQEVGSGPMWQEITYALRGPDDKIYVYSHGGKYNTATSSNEPQREIYRVDPDTGAREIVWRWAQEIDKYGQCSNGAGKFAKPIQLAHEGGVFELAADGSFYIGVIRNGNPKPGVGFMEVSSDGKTCRIVSMNQGDPGNVYEKGVGSGFAFGIAVEAINEIDGVLYAIDNKTLFKIDRKTGDRELLLNGVAPGIMQYDNTRDIFHVTSMEPPYVQGGIYAFDLNEPKLHQLSRCVNIAEDHPFSENCIGTVSGNAYGGSINQQGWLLPDNRHMITVNFSTTFMKVDLKTGVGNHFAY